MQAVTGLAPMDVLSPRNPNIPNRPRPTTKKLETKSKPKMEEKNVNPDKIDDKWRPPTQVIEPGHSPDTYLTGRKLGKGGFAVCFEGTVKSINTNTPQLVALKVVKAKIEQKKMAEKFRTELQIHAKMCHPNIVEFHRAFNFDQHTYVVLELCHNGNLNDMVKARSCLSLPEVRRYMIQICGGVKYMHKRSVIHRDLKMGNIFLDSQMNVKIGDFGLAAVMVDEQDRRTTLCGTPNYIAPEILSKSGARGHDNKVDTWATGVICYAMLIGTPPFQSKTQQEIYQKLRSLEYEWKIDSKNYIPQEAKDLVAACLNLDSTKRPGMDEIVDHEFFSKDSFIIAGQLDVGCLKEKPKWLLNLDPRGDAVQPGTGVSYYDICEQCGVGKLGGSPRPAVGEKANISTIIEIEAENRRECAPTMPLADGVIYKHFAEAAADWNAHRQHPIQSARQRVLKTSSDTVGATAANAIEVTPSTATTMAPPARPLSVSRPIPSFAAQQRQQALPTRPVSRQIDVLNSTVAGAGTSKDMPPPSREYLKERPVRSASVRNLRSNTTRDATVEPQRVLPKSNTISGGINIVSKNATDEVQPTLRVRTAGRSRPKPELAEPALDELQAQAEMQGQPKQSALDSAAPAFKEGKSISIPPRVLRETSGNDRVPVLGSAEESAKPLKRTLQALSSTKSDKSTISVTSSVAPLLPAKMYLISASEPYSILPRSSHSDTIASLKFLYETLSPTGAATPSPFFKDTKRNRHPRVERWVDYTTKHGIAYLLSDETVGMVLMSKESDPRPACSMVIRNARDFILARAKGKNDQITPQGRYVSPIEFFEPAGEEGMRTMAVPAKHFKIDLEKYQEENAAVRALLATCDRCEAERVSLVALADKFGKYMAKKTGADDDCAEKEQYVRGLHITFYQRLGNVGLWRFNDGSIQVNFPDHTKAMMFPREDKKGETHWMVDVVHMDCQDAVRVKELGIQSSSSLERRDQSTWRVQDIVLGNLNTEDKALVKFNEIKEKMQWVRAVVGCWIKEGGLGRMGDEKVGWTGIGMDLEKVKMSWCTVGRDGGDWEGRSGKGRGGP